MSNIGWSLTRSLKSTLFQNSRGDGLGVTDTHTQEDSSKSCVLYRIPSKAKVDSNVQMVNFYLKHHMHQQKNGSLIFTGSAPSLIQSITCDVRGSCVPSGALLRSKK